MNLKEKLNLILSKVSLDEESKNIWQNSFNYLNTRDLVSFIDLLEQFTEDEIKELTDNVKRKIEALKNGDKKSLEVILEEEKIILA